jgi:hypothetical protein
MNGDEGDDVLRGEAGVDILAGGPGTDEGDVGANGGFETDCET